MHTGVLAGRITFDTDNWIVKATSPEQIIAPSINVYCDDHHRLLRRPPMSTATTTNVYCDEYQSELADPLSLKVEPILYYSDMEAMTMVPYPAGPGRSYSCRTAESNGTLSSLTGRRSKDTSTPGSRMDEK